MAALKELQSQGYDMPDYPEDPQTDEEKAIRARFDAIKGSAVNPVLREGNSDRRAAIAVKNYAKANPHSMGKWSPDSKTCVTTMARGDFRSNETSATLTAAQAGAARIEHVAKDGTVTVLKDELSYPAGTVVDATFMSATALEAFLAEQIEASKRMGVLFSIHLKATMMKVSDPIIFGHAVRQFLKPVFDKHGAALAAAGVNPNSGLGALLDRVAEMPDGDAIARRYRGGDGRPPADVHGELRQGRYQPACAVGRDHRRLDPGADPGGWQGLWPGWQGRRHQLRHPRQLLCRVYDEAIRYFKATGALDPSTAGTVQNVGLMAQKAEEYGSHPTTFEIPARRHRAHGAGQRRCAAPAHGAGGRHLACRLDPSGAIEDWVKLAISRQKAEGCQAVFWLDETRAHDARADRLCQTDPGSGRRGGQVPDPRPA